MDNKLMNIVVVLDKDYKVDVELELKVDKVNLNEELMKQPSKMAWFSTLHSLAIEKRDKLSLELDIVSAELDKTIREKPGDYGLLKVTEGAVFNAVHNDALYISKKTELIEAKRETSILSGIVGAFEQRCNCLTSLSANYRREFGGDISIKKEFVRE